MRGSERNAASTARASSGLSKASAAVLFEAMASLRVLSSCRLEERTATNSPTRNSTVVSSNATPVDISVIALSLWRMGVLAARSALFIAHHLRGTQQLGADDQVAGLGGRQVDAHADPLVFVDQHDDHALFLGAVDVGDGEHAAPLQCVQH